MISRKQSRSRVASKDASPPLIFPSSRRRCVGLPIEVDAPFRHEQGISCKKATILSHRRLGPARGHTLTHTYTHTRPGERVQPQSHTQARAGPPVGAAGEEHICRRPSNHATRCPLADKARVIGSTRLELNMHTTHRATRLYSTGSSQTRAASFVAVEGWARPSTQEPGPYTADPKRTRWHAREGTRSRITATWLPAASARSPSRALASSASLFLLASVDTRSRSPANDSELSECLG